MEIADTDELIKGDLIHEYETLCRYKEILFDAVNRAFGHVYLKTDLLELLPRHRFRIISGSSRWYDWGVAQNLCGGIALYLVEHENNQVMGEAKMDFDELVFEIGDMAVILPQAAHHNLKALKCVVETPGGSVKYPLRVVNADVGMRKFRELLSFLAVI